MREKREERRGERDKRRSERKREKREERKIKKMSNAILFCGNLSQRECVGRVIKCIRQD